ncbi:choice-of-anchor A family protein [Duganella sp. sic0402]|uniref:choice-of-anchor A family protein n=1 Tax=Duganella sp. sic0402 TaxID=2854786 RepID=UPI001C487E92|nr:choice-of-anchor A family protein [Duganella sp. sic0402]MBV7536379.1 choice-of-anchor A family protein [Duganella sp. sic0402]
MTNLVKSTLAVAALVLGSLGSAQAGVLDLSGAVGKANVFSFTDFSAPYATVQGAIMAGRDVTLTSYSVNQNNQDAYGRYSLVVGGHLNFSNGTIFNGDVYAAGGVTYPSWGAPLSAGYSTYSGTAPVNMTQLASSLTRTSAQLAAITPTSIATQTDNRIILTGTKSAVEVISVDATMMNKATDFVLSNFATDATIIVNVVGNSATIQGGYQQFDNYNVLFNFVGATELKIGTGAAISILAPTASVLNGSGHIDGTVVVNSWDSGVTIKSGNAFAATNIAALAVPEPGGYAMVLAGLGLIVFTGRRRQKPVVALR